MTKGPSAMCRIATSSYRRQVQARQACRKVYEGLQAIRRSPQNKNRAKGYHRAMKVVERHKQTKLVVDWG